MKKIFIFLLLVGLFLQSFAQQTKEDKTITIYDFKVEGLEGDEINFSDFKGKKILIVNTASECGFTPQYEDLETLYEQYQDRLVIVGFPSNDFGGQEPGTSKAISMFCKQNYGVSFPMAAKVSVKGQSIAPIFKFLTKKDLNGVKETNILWNFTKFLIDENGKLIDSFPSKVKPTSEEIMKHLNQFNEA